MITSLTINGIPYVGDLYSAPVKSGDLITNGLLKFDEPTAIFDGRTGLRFERCNLGNVIWTEPISLTDAQGTVHNYDAAHWASDWTAYKCYNMPQKPMHYLQSVRDYNRMLKEFNAIKEQLLALNKAGEDDQFRAAVRPYIKSGIGWAELERVLGIKIEPSTLPSDWDSEVA